MENNTQESVTEKIRQNPKFQILVSRRGRFAWTLSAIVLVVFYGFVMLVAFNPAALGASLTGSSQVTVGFAAGLFMFVSFWLLTAYYVRRANTEFDAMTREVVEEAWREARQ
jgi:uncharacterized membrane protein (DUF485 family)